MEERSKIINTKVLERTPGGFISKMKITEEALDGSGKFTHTYYLTHDKLQHKVNKYIEKTIKKSKKWTN